LYIALDIERAYLPACESEDMNPRCGNNTECCSSSSQLCSKDTFGSTVTEAWRSLISFSNLLLKQ